MTAKMAAIWELAECWQSLIRGQLRKHRFGLQVGNKWAGKIERNNDI